METGEFTANARNLLLRDVRNGKMNVEEVIATQTTIYIDKSQSGEWRYYMDERLVNKCCQKLQRKLKKCGNKSHNLALKDNAHNW